MATLGPTSSGLATDTVGDEATMAVEDSDVPDAAAV
jgi:hypothetical protein